MAPESRAGRIGLGGALGWAWVGYRRLLDAELAAAGFADHGLPDGRVLRICARTGETTMAQIGRQLGITRQGAGKIVASLRDREYVTLNASTTDAREKIVTLTPRAIAFLAAHRQAARRIEHQLRTQIGPDALDALYRLLDALAADDQQRIGDYLRTAGGMGALESAED